MILTGVQLWRRHDVRRASPSPRFLGIEKTPGDIRKSEKPVGSGSAVVMIPCLHPRAARIAEDVHPAAERTGSKLPAQDQEPFP
jgi:hypothetical protein